MDVLIIVLGVLGITTTHKFLKQYHQRKLLELQHRQRMELAQRAEHLIQILLVDKELGAEVTKLLQAPPEVLLLPPGPPSRRSVVVHFKASRGSSIPCGLDGDKFPTSPDLERVTCKRCLSLAES